MNTEPLKAFLEEHFDKVDNYEVYGKFEKPNHPLTMGYLRAVYREMTGPQDD